MKLFLEVIASNLQDVIEINRTKASRIEFCVDLKKDGLSPDVDLIKEALRISKVPINVMVRFATTHFLTDDLVKQMIAFIDEVKTLKPHGFVIGGLTKKHEVDVENMKKIVSHAKGFNLTFHNCFNQIKDKEAAIKQIAKLGFKNILTSGKTSNSFESLSELTELSKIAKKEGVILLVGGGINKDNIESFAKVAQNPLHIGSGARFATNIEMPIDVDKIAYIIETWNSVN